MPFTIRKATPDDAAAACAVLRRSIQECCGEDHQGRPAVLEAWLRNKTPEIVRRWFSSSTGYAVVAEAGGAIVGTAMMDGDRSIILCYLVPEARYQGVGKAMLAAVEAEARARGFAAVDLQSTKSGHAFYRRNGYVDTGSPVSVFGIEAYPMRKNLAPVR
jgi:GNAT superfamily N-acetyltransferase